MAELTATSGTVDTARELCRAGGALVAAVRDEGTAAELAAMFAALQAEAAGRLASLQREALLRKRFEEQGLYSGWTSGGASMLTWGLQTLPGDLWSRSGMCPSHRVVMLAATSKCVRGLLGRLQWRVSVALRIQWPASMQSAASALPGMLAWCSVVKLNLCSEEIDSEGVRILAGALGQCSSLASLNLERNNIGDEGTRSLAGVLGQCSSLATLDLSNNNLGAEGARSLAGVLWQCSSLAMLTCVSRCYMRAVIWPLRPASSFAARCR